MRLKLEVIGDKRILTRFRGIRKRYKKTSERASHDLSRDIQRGTRHRITRRLKGDVSRYSKPRTGNLWKSVKTIRRGRYWTCQMGGPEAKYATIQEYGKTISGWHFIPKYGYGRGFSVPGGNISIPGHYMMTDAIKSTRRRAKNIVRRRFKRLFK
jgi:hypothetical protein